MIGRCGFPDHFLDNLVWHLDYKTITIMKCVSKQWSKRISSNDRYWQHLFQKDFGEAGHKVDFEKQYHLEYKWRFKPPKIVDLHGHTRTLRCLACHDSILVSGSGDKTVRTWDLQVMQCVRVFIVASFVNSVALNGNILVAGMFNGKIAIWDLASGNRHLAWQGHHDSVRDVILANDYIISGGWDNLVNTWDISNGDCLQRFHVPNFNKLCIHASDIVCGTKDGNVYVSNVNNHGGLVHTLDIKECVDCVCSNGHHLFASQPMGKIVIWNQKEKQQEAMSDLDHRWVVSIQCDLVRLVTAMHCGKIKIWNTWNGACVREFEIADRSINCMCYDGGNIIVGFSSGSIRVFSINS